MSPTSTIPGWIWLRALACAAVAMLPTAGLAHDAFGDLGPFYASLLHPVADPLQAALLLGISAFLASRSLSFVRVALPLLVVASAAGAFALAGGLTPALPPLLAPLIVLVVGLAAMVPTAVKPRLAGFALVAFAAALTGLAPGQPGDGMVLQWVSGTIFGIALLALLAWYALDAAARHVTSIAPMLAGSWVAAVGILIVAFSA